MEKTLVEKVLYLKAVQAGQENITDIENPIKKLDINNIPCSTVADFIEVLTCCWYADQFPRFKKEQNILLEASIKAGRACGIVDDATEIRWRLGKPC